VRSDPRDPRRVDFTLHALRKPRVWHMAAGSAAANDANPLRHDPICKVRRDRLPASGPPLASPPTLSRCEKRVSRTALSRLARGFVEQCIAAYDRPPTRIVLDCDDTEAPAHGAQEPSRDDGYDGGYGGLPLHGYAGRSGRLMTTLFKAKRVRAAQRLGVVQRRRQCLRQAWPDTLMLVRGDSHGASPEVRQWSEAQAHLHDVTGLTSTRVLPKLAHEVVAQATRAYARDGGTVTRFHATRSQAGTWSQPRRVVRKVAVSAPGVNTRCVVTDLEQARAQGL
jgi:Transposase DDE domain group 1